MRGGASVRARRPEPSGASAPTAPGLHAVERVLAGVRFGEGIRVGVLGDSGTGKTHAAQAVVTAYLRACPGVVLVADAKGERRFGGQVYNDPADLGGRPPAAEPRVLTFVGDPWHGRDVDAEEVARLAWAMGARRVTTLQVHDELEEACKVGQWKRGVVQIPRTFTRGRALGLSVMWGTQSPQGVPREAFEQSDHVLCFRIGGMGLDLLRRRGYLEGVPAGLIESLPGPDVPPRERGLFVLLTRGRPWDGRTYRL